MGSKPYAKATDDARRDEHKIMTALGKEGATALSSAVVANMVCDLYMGLNDRGAVCLRT